MALKCLKSITLICLCSIGLIYQSSILFFNYQMGNTVVNVQIMTINQDHLPGLTICYEYMLSMEKLANVDQTIGHIYEKYINLFNVSDQYAFEIDKNSGYKLDTLHSNNTERRLTQLI